MVLFSDKVHDSWLLDSEIVDYDYAEWSHNEQNDLSIFAGSEDCKENLI